MYQFGYAVLTVMFFLPTLTRNFICWTKTSVCGWAEHQCWKCIVVVELNKEHHV
jgi:hypothetical protein